jgi:beta-glucosidase
VTLSPVADLGVDPRWGRTEETFGEDPALAATATRSVVRGLADAGVVATPKHFVGHGRPAGGRNRARPTASLAELGDADLLPFRVAVAAGAPSLMVAYNTLDGVPCHANRALLTDLLRETWEFDGTVVSDGRGIEMLATDYGVVPDRRAAGVAALTAGVDVELPETACFGDRLVAAVRAGVVDESVVDRAVQRHLRQKIDAGLIDTELVDASDAFETDELWSLSRRAARRSQVLLSNDGTLPLSPDSHVALVGPNADEPRHLLGNYSYAAAENADAGTTVSTPRTALSERVDSSTHVRGCGVRPEGEGNIQSAVDAAAAADVTVACVGGSSGIDVERESQGTAGEALDRASLRLPGRQLELIERVAATGTPLVVVYVGGRPPALPTVAERADALLVAWLPGQAGGEAIADVLLGADPGGRLPVSLPRAVGTLPVYHWQDTVSRGWGEADVEQREKSDTDGLEESDAEDSAYVFTDGSPLFPFGYGESYAAFEYDSLAVASADEDTLTLSTTVENTAERAGTTVVQLYRTGFEPGWTDPNRDTVADEDTQPTVVGEDTQSTVVGEDTRCAPTDEWMQATSARTVRPASELVGFQRLDLDAGARVELQFDLPAAVLARSDGDGRRVVDPGVYEFTLARSATDHVASVSVDLPGERRETDEFAVVADTVVERTDDG